MFHRGLLVQGLMLTLGITRSKALISRIYYEAHWERGTGTKPPDVHTEGWVQCNRMSEQSMKIGRSLWGGRSRDRQYLE
jgi:hypothetical protein